MVKNCNRSVIISENCKELRKIPKIVDTCRNGGNIAGKLRKFMEIADSFVNWGKNAGIAEMAEMVGKLRTANPPVGLLDDDGGRWPVHKGCLPPPQVCAAALH